METVQDEAVHMRLQLGIRKTGMDLQMILQTLSLFTSLKAVQLDIESYFYGHLETWNLDDGLRCGFNDIWGARPWNAAFSAPSSDC